jgi:uncharacterized membrane protein
MTAFILYTFLSIFEGKFMEENAVNPNPEVSKKPWKECRDFFASTTNGMAIGLFGTLIIGTIISLFARIPGFESIGVIANLIKGLMGAGIGLGVALSLKLGGVKLVALMAAGALGNLAYEWSSGTIIVVTDPLCCYLSALLAYAAIRYLHPRNTPVDLILIPLLALGLSIAFTYLLSYWVHYVTLGIGKLIELSFQAVPFLMCIVVAVLVGMALTAPISSVAICVAINIGSVPLAAGAALIGCCSQMIGFAVETAYDNKWGNVLAVGLGTSMLQFKNIVRKPLIWVPTTLVSALLAPFALLFHFASDSVGAGMGTSGLVGLLNTFAVMNYEGAAIVEVLSICVAAPIVLTFLIDGLFRKLGWIKKGDFALDEATR